MRDNHDEEMEQVYHGYMSYLYDVVKSYTPDISIKDFTDLVNSLFLAS